MPVGGWARYLFQGWNPLEQGLKLVASLFSVQKTRLFRVPSFSAYRLVSLPRAKLSQLLVWGGGGIETCLKLLLCRWVGFAPVLQSEEAD